MDAPVYHLGWAPDVSLTLPPYVSTPPVTE